MPLERRNDELRMALTSLRTSHSAFLQPEMSKTLPLQEVMTLYRPWKVKEELSWEIYCVFQSSLNLRYAMCIP